MQVNTPHCTAKLDQLAMVKRGRSRHRPRNALHLYGGPYPFVQTGEVKAAEFWIHGTGQTYSEAGLEQSRLWPRGTVCVTIAANIAESGMLAVDACFPDSVVGVTARPEKADPSFLKYALDYMQVRLQAVSGGTTQDNLSVQKLLSFDFPAPTLCVQRQVAYALRSFDNLIENNLRRIEILEEMARLLYREWFADFRFPGHEDVELSDSDIGPIPDGWKAVRLGNVLELAYGKALRAGDRRGGPMGVYGSGGHVGWHDEALVTGPGIVVGRKGNVGSVYWSDGDFFPIDTTYYVKSDLPLRFLDQLLRTLKYVDSHAAVPGLSRDQAYGLIVAEPTGDLLSRYETAVRPMYDLRRNLSNQTAVLREARDLLLPRLVSGELDVSDLGLGLEAVEL